MSRQIRVNPVSDAMHYIRAGTDRDGLEKRHVSEAVGECSRLLFSYYIVCNPLEFGTI